MKAVVIISGGFDSTTLLHYVVKELKREVYALSFNYKQKAKYVEELGAEYVVAFGNGKNDRKMLKKASLGIAIMLEEGCAVETLLNADIIVKSPVDAVDLLLNPKRLVAVLRT